MEFSWDRRKAATNARKHGVSFDEAVTAFFDALNATIPDPDHSIGEQRFLLLGRSSAGRLLVVAHVDHGTSIRIVSARKANAHERKDYENR